MAKNTKITPDDNMPTAVEINIDAEVNHINELIGNKLYETAIEVGNYVLKKFFKDDIEEVKSKIPIRS